MVRRPLRPATPAPRGLVPPIRLGSRPSRRVGWTFLSGLSGVVALSGALIFSSSCRGSNDSHAKTPVELRVGIAFPAGTQSPLGSFVDNSLIYETLVGIGWDGRPVPRLAESWQWSDDRLNLTLHLQPNVKFHDGTTLDAPLVSQILADVISPTSAISYGSVTSVNAVDARTLVIHLKEPESFLLTDLANSHIRRRQPADTGTGPFRLVKRDSGLAQVVAFDGYYRGRPAIDSIEARTYQDQRTAWAALLR